jgi:cysteine-rich repeat protein
VVLAAALAGACAIGQPSDGGMPYDLDPDTDGGEDEASGTDSGDESDDAADAAASAGDESGDDGDTGPICGNGEIELGEQCDDGNLTHLDECTTGCTIPTCTDGLHSGMETGRDCGGPCAPCEQCGGCQVADDCVAGTVCGELGVCTLQWDVTIDWFANCGMADENAVVTPGLPAGDYLAIARSGGGTVWNPPWNPPANGWSWHVQCGGFELEELRTPSGTYYATADEAFANLLTETEGFAFAGGDLRCYRSDSACSDNQGSVSFTVELRCD